MLIGTNQKLSKLANCDLNLSVNGYKLDNELLGVHLDNNLTYTKHIYSACS